MLTIYLQLGVRSIREYESELEARHRLGHMIQPCTVSVGSDIGCFSYCMLLLFLHVFAFPVRLLLGFFCFALMFSSNVFKDLGDGV